MPKKTDFAKVPESQIKYIENQLNSRPRKCLNFATPYDVLLTASVALHGWMWELIEFDKLFGVYYCLISYGIVNKLWRILII